VYFFAGKPATAIKLSPQAGCSTLCRRVDKQSASTHRAHRTRHPCHATQKIAGCAALIQPTDTRSPRGMEKRNSPYRADINALRQAKSLTYRTYANVDFTPSHAVEDL